MSNELVDRFVLGAENYFLASSQMSYDNLNVSAKPFYEAILKCAFKRLDFQPCLVATQVHDYYDNDRIKFKWARYGGACVVLAIPLNITDRSDPSACYIWESENRNRTFPDGKVLAEHLKKYIVR